MDFVEQRGRCAGSLWRTIHATHTHVHTGEHVINIVVVAARACINYSAPSRKCVVATAMGAPRGSQHY